MTETVYEGPAQGATFYLPTPGSIRFGFSDPRASGYVRSSTGAMARVQPGTRLSLPRGEQVLSLYAISLLACMSIIFEPRIGKPHKRRCDIEDGRKAGHTYSRPDVVIAATALHQSSSRAPLPQQPGLNHH